MFEKLFGNLNANEPALNESVDATFTVSDNTGITTLAPMGTGTTAFLTATVTEKEEAPAPRPEAQDVIASMDANEFTAYERTCQAIGFAPAALIEAQILAFMAEKKMRRYAMEQVMPYLRQKAQKASAWTTWHWRPLRAADSAPDNEYNVRGWAAREQQRSSWGFVSMPLVDGSVTGTPYQLAIPLRVLGRVEQIVQKFGDKVRFLVSDYAERKPDPFIAVVPKAGGDPIVFDVWDEPDFK